MTNLLFYDKPVALNKATHANARIKALPSHYAFAAKTNSVLLAGIEFVEAAKEYPIVFTQAGERVVPVAMLGLRKGENLYVGESGHWDARYIPAFVRRYPFVLADTQDRTQQVVCIDEAYQGLNEAEGERLFTETGEPTQVLRQAMDFLEDFQKQYLRTEQFVQRLQKHGLLANLSAKVELAEGKQISVAGLMAVDERRLRELPDAAVLEYFRAGDLGWIYCHLQSLGGLKRMAELVLARTKAEQLQASRPDAGTH